MEPNDSSLMVDFVATRSDAAFGALVDRYLNLVYSTALRQVQNHSMAQEISQQVFLLLARKASRLSRDVVLIGWLYRATCKISYEALRRERRRKQREEKAMHTLYDSNSSEDWERIAPILDEAMAALNGADREVILLRFFENKPLREVGAVLGISEDTAQKRVSRALERMRNRLLRRGVSISGAALSAAISGSAVHAAPLGLGVTILSATAGTAVSAGIAGASIFGGNLMSLINMKAGLTLAGAAVAVTVLVTQHYQIGALKEQNASWSNRNAELQLAYQKQVGLNAGWAEELARLREESAEVHRLRGEVARLRRERDTLAALQVEADQLKKQLEQIQDEKSSEIEEFEKERAQARQKLGHAKLWVLALLRYARENEGQFPASVQALESFYPKEAHQAAGLEVTGQLAPDQWEIVFQGKQNEIENPSSTVLLREKLPTKVRDGWARAYCFADGHSEYPVVANGDFENWERERSQRNP